MHKSLEYIAGKIDISRDLILLLVIGGLYSLSIFLSNTFVNIYLWKQAGDYMTIAFYNLGIYLFQPLTFILAGKIAKKVDRVIVLRLGVIFLSLFFLSVLLIAEEASKYNFMLGSVLGVGYGFYWLAFNVLTFEITEPESRDFFNGFLGVLQSFAGMIGPLLAGTIIAGMQENVGYSVIFTISFILFIVAVVCSFFLKRRKAEGLFHFKRVLMERNHNKNWKKILNAHVSQGLREGIFLFVISIWVFITTQSEFALGMFNLFLSGLSFVFYFIVTKWVKPSLRKKAILTGALILYFSVYIILFNINYTQLMIYAVLIGIAYPIINVPYASLTYDVIGKAWKAKEFRVEYIVVRELFVNIGRVSSIVTFLIAITLFPAETIIPYLLAIFGLGHLFIYLFVNNIYLGSPGKKDAITKEPLTDEKNR
ncbi:MFS transporter, YQGE family, putative transporter [Lentibacillus halodurans]|uniref:MFS transporter, YQGE family, putative transporter n=1 Tax=Lentibacillus halodurans TaxID=237679 RepID=A0A1I0V3C8_9BACI|nr:MFS transporter [Lentibacillus halodurans]SFA70781.1 MFS transporter, YQGE family, putative transporter [Lentibacillus halodurans]